MEEPGLDDLNVNGLERGGDAIRAAVFQEQPGAVGFDNKVEPAADANGEGRLGVLLVTIAGGQVAGVGELAEVGYGIGDISGR